MLNAKKFLWLFCLTSWLIKVTPLAAEPYVSFQGNVTGWYFNYLKVPGGKLAIRLPRSQQRVTGWEGPLASQQVCQQQAEQIKDKVTSACYERETLEYYRWKRRVTSAWVLPLETGETSRMLVMASREDCDRVKSGDHYYTLTGEKALLPSDLKFCLQIEVTFEEFAKRYAWMSRHDSTPAPPPTLYRAWSLPVNEGRLVTLLQFGGQYAEQWCKVIRQHGFYFNEIRRSGFGNMPVRQPITAQNPQCSRRGPQGNEVPVIYRFVENHQGVQVEPKSDPSAGQQAWLLTVLVRGVEKPLLFQSEEKCWEVIRQGYYYRVIDRGGIIPDDKTEIPFNYIKADCVAIRLDQLPKQGFYDSR